jgi:hypothetical protein
MVGEDQASMPIAQALMKAVNKFQGYEHVKVSLEVTPRGTGMSFTKLRNILKDPNATPQQQYAVWAQGFDEQKLGKEWIMHLMDLTRKGMGVGAEPAKLAKKPKQIAPNATHTPDTQPMEAMLPKSAFAGSDKNKLGPAAHAKGKQKSPVRKGQFVGGEAVNAAQQAAIAIAKKKKQNVKEFAPDNGDSGEEDTLLKYARMWYNGDDSTQQKVEQVLDRMGWEIGEIESEEGGAFVVRSGDEHGKSYISFAPEDLSDGIEEEKQRLDPKCWKGYRKAGTKMKGGKRVNNCVPVGEEVESIMSSLIEQLQRK